LRKTLFPHWLITAVMALTVGVYLLICHVYGHLLQEPLPEQQRLVIRSVLYAVAIVLFPMTNLIRHVQLRLNKTMPGNKPAQSRYLLTVAVSVSIMQSIGVFGFLLFMLGDDFNTLYIFTLLSVLGLFLYRPKEVEFNQIVTSLTQQQNS
jgi:hypothetical protein